MALESPEEKVLESFRGAIKRLGIRTGEQSLAFPSTRVLLASGTLEQLATSVDVVDSIAELRRAKEVASVFMEMPRWEMGRWVDDLLSRTLPPPADAPSICLLDTGVNAEWEKLIQRCGFGVPSLERALWSADNRLTLVAQESVQPFLHKRNETTGSRSTTLKELQIYELPWPVEELRELGNVEVELRVTLSYFIEPNPSERGYRYRHRYSSHGFRFDVRAAAEPLEDFRKRLNKAAREQGERSPGTGDSSRWVLGERLRHRGSLHSDIWRGPAVDLANRQHLAVFPVSGWWKERFNLERWRRRARYSLVVSIHAPEIEVDLYTPVRTALETPVRTWIEIPRRQS